MAEAETIGPRRIQQSTFNEAVAENIEEFEMEFEEALSDAKDQFAGEGFDISDLITDDLGDELGSDVVAAGGDALLAALRSFKHPVERSLEEVSNVTSMDSGTGAFASEDALSKASAAFSAVVAVLSEKPGETGDASRKQARILVSRNRCIDHGMVPALCALLDRVAHSTSGLAPAEEDGTSASGEGGARKATDAVLASACAALERGLVALRRLCYKSDRARRQVTIPAVDACLVGLKNCKASKALGAAAARCAGVVATKSEGFKRRLHAGHAARMGVALVAANEEDDEVVKGCCAMLRTITAKDDPSATVAEGFEHAKVIAADGESVPVLVASLARAGGLVPSIPAAWGRAADLMLAIRSLHINNETCNALLDSGAIAKVILPVIRGAVEVFAAQDPARSGSGTGASAAAATSTEAGEAAEEKSDTEEPDVDVSSLKRAVRVGCSLLRALCNSDAVKRAMVDTVLAAGGAGAAAGADWSGGGSRAAMGMPESSAAADATAVAAAAAAEAALAGSASGGESAHGLEGPIVGSSLLLRVMHVFREHVEVADQALAALANTVLRVRETARFLIEQGGAQAVLTLMRRYPENGLVQRHGAATLRNSVSWDKSLIKEIVAAGAEPVLKAAMEAHAMIAGEAARAAIRDLVLD